MAKSSDVPSWSSLAAKGCVKKLDKNVMEIILEKDVKGAFNATDTEAAKVLQKLGVDVSNQVEMVQICPLGKNIIQVTLKEGVNMDRFIGKEAVEVKSGMRVSHVRSAGQREVTLHVRGLHPQTPDSKVFDYLRCMGKVQRTKVILDVYNEGPLKGLQNGDRRYFVEFSPYVSVGTLHILDGQKVTFTFAGQKRSCFRCLKVSNECLGNGIARECEAAGGQRKLLAVHMQEFWTQIKYSPEEADIPVDLDECQEEIEQQVGGAFTPKSKQNASESENRKVKKCGALSVKWFPKKADHGDVKQFLVRFGLPEDHTDIKIKDNGQVIIDNLDSTICDKLSESITGNKFNGKKTIYCQGIVLATPEKSAVDKGDLQQQQSELQSETQGKQDNSFAKYLQKTCNETDNLNGYVFADVKNSKFFAKPLETESESDNVEDSYNNDEDWLSSTSRKKRKQKLKNKTNSKKLDIKKTPQSK